MARLHEQYTGKDLELDLLGYAVKPKARYINGIHKDFNESLALVRENQPDEWNPEDPPAAPTKLPNDLHFVVTEKLEEKLGNHDWTLKFWDALESFLDRIHGTDAFFTFAPHTGNRREIIVKLDVTKNRDKAINGGKPGVIVVYTPIPYEELTDDQRAGMLEKASREVVTHIEGELRGARHRVA